MGRCANLPPDGDYVTHRLLCLGVSVGVCTAIPSSTAQVVQINKGTRLTLTEVLLQNTM